MQCLLLETVETSWNKDQAEIKLVLILRRNHRMLSVIRIRFVNSQFLRKEIIEIRTISKVYLMIA